MIKSFFKNKETKQTIIFLSVVLTTLLLFFPSFNSFFSQDDFFHLRASLVNSFSDLIKFISFSPIRGYAFYRPISREIYNFAMWSVFGFNPFVFHLVQFIFFVLILFFFRKLVYLIFPKGDNKNNLIGNLSIFIYSISAFNLGTFYYLGSVQILLATLFVLLTTIDYLNGQKKRSLLFFIISLCCHEISYSIPVVLLVLSLFKKQNIKETVIKLIPYFILVTIIAMLNIGLVKLPNQTAYYPKFSPKVIVNNFVWYLFWGIGIPEHMLDFVGPGLNINQKIISLYPLNFIIMAISFCSFSVLILFSIIKFIYKKTDNVFFKKSLFFFLFFAISISPFLILPAHRFVYYLILPGIWFSILLSIIISKQNKILGTTILILYFVLNVNTISWGQKTYWPIGRSILAEKIIKKIISVYPNPQKNSAIYLKNDLNYISPNSEWGGTAKQAFFALSGADGLQLIYNDFDLKVFFEGISSPSAGLKYLPLVVELD